MTIDELLKTRLATIAGMAPEHITPIQAQLRTFESDFDKAQSSLRTIASAWILAAIGAVGLVTQAEFGGTSRLDPAVAASARQILLLAATLGLSSLWYLDQRVYQRLLHAVYSLGCHLELETEKVLPIRTRTYLLNFDVTHHMGWFYRAPLWVLVAASVGGLYQSLFGFNSTLAALLNDAAPSAKPTQIWALPLLITIIHVGFFIVITCRSRKWPSLDDLLPAKLRDMRTAQKTPSVAAATATPTPPAAPPPPVAPADQAPAS